MSSVTEGDAVSSRMDVNNEVAQVVGGRSTGKARVGLRGEEVEDEGRTRRKRGGR